MKVVIGQACDGFSIQIVKEENKEWFYFDQEDSVEKLVEVFEILGIEASFEECY